MSRILILIGAHLCTAPRPQKEAQALRDAGHDVAVRGVWFDPILIDRDRALMRDSGISFSPVLDFSPASIKGRIERMKVRLKKKAANEAFGRSGKFSPDLFGHGAQAMLTMARQHGADLTIVHSEAGLWAATQLLDEGRFVGVDFEDWFSEDLSAEARAMRPNDLLKSWERRLAQSCTYCLATSDAMAAALADAYGASRPATVYNVFPFSERARLDGKRVDRKDASVPSLHWFSQTIGPGRGLEVLFRALNHVRVPVEVHLRGALFPYDRTWFEQAVPEAWKPRVFVHETVPNAELLSRIAEHDIGLALETDAIPSRDLTVTNKLFQYLQAGLAVIATDTAGQREVLGRAREAGLLIENNSEVKLAEAIGALASDPEHLARAKAAALQAAREQFCWELQRGTLVARAEEALAATMRP